MKTIKSQIESLGFNFLHETKKDGLYYAFSPISGGILINGKNYNQVLDNIETYFKSVYSNNEPIKEVKNLTKATELIEQGFKHLQWIQGGCIQKKKINGVVCYVTKDGLGTGSNLDVCSTLQEAVEICNRLGWSEIKSYK